DFSDGLYHAGPEDVIEAARWVPVDAQTVIYVGHNPTAGELPHLLDDGNGDRNLLAEIATGYPTSAVSVFEVESPWADLRMGSARLVDFFVGDRR
ncbi:MAG TPA: histidine phosphatase family protein, partial [Marmoricola sp.]|nr:histidine phosphatase family protein [Marmoricola sp.]